MCNLEIRQEKANIIGNFMINFKNHDYARRLSLIPDLGELIPIDDWRAIRDNRIFLNIAFSPGVTSPVELNVTKGSQLITIDYNMLIKMDKEERIAVVLHELGHAFSPHLTGIEGEFAADDYAIKNGYGSQIKGSLENLIISNPDEFDKQITHERILRIG